MPRKVGDTCVCCRLKLPDAAVEDGVAEMVKT